MALPINLRTVEDVVEVKPRVTPDVEPEVTSLVRVIDRLGYSNEVQDLVHTAVYGRSSAVRAQALADLLQYLGVTR